MDKKTYQKPVINMIALRLEERLATCDQDGTVPSPTPTSDSQMNPGHCGGSSQWANSSCGGTWNHIHCPGGSDMLIS